MSRWTRHWRTFAVGLILVAGAIAWTWWVYRLPPTERNDALGFWGFVLGLAGVLVPLLLWLGRGQFRTDLRPVNALAALLAQAVYGQWRKAADERRLVTPAPIPLRWSLSTLDVAGPVTAAVGAPDAPPAFQPLPGHTTITEADLRAGGGRRELHHLYSGLASGRIIVVGAPGAGKSGTAILLLLDALGHREQLDDAMRARCPVPVLFTAHGWDPVTCSAQDWLATRLVADYPLFGRRNGPAEAAALLTARDKVTLILDGLDEMDQALRPAALQALSDAPFRVVVLTRSPELIQAASQQWLVGAVAVHLHDVTAPDAADYLQRARTGPPPSGWPDLLTHLHEHPDGTLARGLSTPLTLTLLRDTYQPGDDVSDLLDPTRYNTTETVERHLIARVLPAAYTPRAGRPPPRYTEEQASQALSFLGHRMNQDHTRELAWWHIPRWTPDLPHFLAPTLAGDLLKPKQFKIGSWRAVLSRLALGRVLVIGLAAGLMIGLVVGLVAGLVVGLVVGLALVVVWGLVEYNADNASPLGPHELWRSDRTAGLASGLAVGLTVGLVTGLIGVPTVGLVAGLMGMLLCFSSITWVITVAWSQLRSSGFVPAVALMPFLEDARERGVLRTVGAVYQFRHAMLQDQLAEQTNPGPLPTSAVRRTS